MTATSTTTTAWASLTDEERATTIRALRLGGSYAQHLSALLSVADLARAQRHADAAADDIARYMPGTDAYAEAQRRLRAETWGVFS